MSIESLVKDTFHHNTTTLLRNSNVTEYEKQMIVKVFKYLTNHIEIKIKNLFRVNTNSKLISLIKKCQTYDELINNINGCESNECLMCNGILVFHIYPKSLLMCLIAICSRTLPLDNSKSWYDNFTLNSYLLQLTTIFYDFAINKTLLSKYNDFVHTFKTGLVDFSNSISNDGLNNTNSSVNNNTTNDDSSNTNSSMNSSTNNTTSSVNNAVNELINDLTNFKHKSNYIDESVKLKNVKSLLFHFGNNYRVFELTGKSCDEISEDEMLNVLDKICLTHPYSTGCCHGADVFWIPDKSPSIEEISLFCKRYPKHILGYILNTATYESGRGQHWVAFIFQYNTVYLICSQASSFDVFMNARQLNSELSNYGFKKIANFHRIQYDSSSCGMFSVLSNLCFIIESQKNSGIDINDIVNRIGVDATNINSNGIDKIKEQITGFK